MVRFHDVEQYTSPTTKLRAYLKVHLPGSPSTSFRNHIPGFDHFRVRFLQSWLKPTFLPRESFRKSSWLIISRLILPAPIELIAEQPISGIPGHKRYSSAWISQSHERYVHARSFIAMRFNMYQYVCTFDMFAHSFFFHTGVFNKH